MRFSVIKLTDKQKQKIRDNFTTIQYEKLNAQQKQYYNSVKGGYSRRKVSEYGKEAALKLAKKLGYHQKGETLQETIRGNPVFAALLTVYDKNPGKQDTAISTILARFDRGKVSKLTVTDGIRTYRGKRARKLLAAMEQYYLQGNRNVFSVVLKGVTYGTLDPFLTVNLQIYQMSNAIRIMKGNIIEPDAPGDLTDEMQIAVESNRVQLIVSDPKARAEREADKAKIEALEKERELLKLPKLKH